MINRQVSYAVLFSSILLAAVSSFSQDTNAAAKAFQTWRAKRVTAEMATDGNYIGMAFAVSKSGAHGAAIDIVVGTGSKVGDLGRVTFTVQPMLVKQDPQAKPVFLPTGDLSSLNFPEVGSERAADSDIVADPRMTINVPSGATVIQITVNDGTKEFSVQLPLLEKTSTAILGGAVEMEGQQLLKCLWYSGDCGSACGGSTFCTGCSTSPNLNCVSCEMGCNNGGGCSPGTPRPPYCSGL